LQGKDIAVILSIEMRASTAETLAESAQRKERVLTSATLRAAELLELTDADVAHVLGVSGATVSRLRSGQRTISLSSKEAELALMLVRVYRSLDGILGEDKEAMRAWFHEKNRHLRGVPAELVLRTDGLVHVLEYLDAMRAKN
jgi:transcriptional regulator with XRE-family HTH domain